MSTQPLENFRLNAGDALDLISYEKFGTIDYWRELAEENGIDIFDRLPIGQDIKIPTLESVKAKALEFARTKALDAATDFLEDGKLDKFDLSSLKQEGTENPWQLINWVL